MKRIITYKTFPLISVVIPVYKVEQYFDECVQSVLNQSYGNMEIILVDDGSPDNCPVMCDEYAEQDERIRVIHQNNAGLSAARNAGVRAAMGKYVWFVDSDDVITENAVELLALNTAENDVDLLLFDRGMLDENTNKHTDKHPDKHPVSPYDVIQRKNNYIQSDGKICLKAQYENDDFDFSACTYIIRRGFLSEEKISFVDGLLHEDVTFTITALLYAKNVKTVRNTLYLTRIRRGSITRSELNKKKIESFLFSYLEINKLAAKEENAGIQNTLLEISYHMLHVALNRGMELLVGSRISQGDLLSIFHSLDLNRPPLEEATQKVIYYGGGDICRRLFRLIPKRPGEVWDKNAPLINKIEDVDCVRPRFGESIEAVVVICIAEYKSYKEVKNQFLSAGYKHIFSCGEYFLNYWILREDANP